MQRIVHGDANDHGGDADDDDRHAVPDQGDASDSENPSECDRKHYPEYIREAFVGENQQQADKEHGQGYGQNAVLFDLRGVGNGDQRRAHSGHGDIRMLRLGPADGLIDQPCDLGVHARLARPVRRSQKRKPMPVFCEYAVIDNVVV